MSIIIDSKTKDPWSSVWVNRALHKIRAKASGDMVARDRQRGIGPTGQVYTTEMHEKGEHKREIVTVDRALAAMRHTGRETRLLTMSRFREFCSVPQSLPDFIASYGDDCSAVQLKAAKTLAAPIEESLTKEAASAPVPKPEAKLSKKSAKPKTTEPTE
ncbi:MAG: hypothetical protein O7D91_17775 [Planctomycetota bacterium]|nr:hypothetical protein [Planctomycetota bacterium]